MEPADAPRGGDADPSRMAMTDGEASGRGGRRPGWAGLFWATVVVLVVGGFALSRNYGVPEVSSGTLPPVPPVPSTSTTTAPSETDTTPLESVDAVYDDWKYQVTDVAVTPDGSVYVAAPVGVAWMDREGEWTLLDIDGPGGLPDGTGLDDRYPGRVVEQIGFGPDGVLWVAGESISPGEWLNWVAYDCPLCGVWHVFTNADVPELAGDIGDMTVAGDGTVYVSVSGKVLVFDGAEWESHPLPTDGTLYGSQTSRSMTVGTDGLVWATANFWRYGLLSFDRVSGFTRYTTADGLPSDKVVRVTTGADGTIWAATEGDDYSGDPAAGVGAFDGTTWTTHTTAEGLLSNHAVIATGGDGTVWAVHPYEPPYGYSRFDGTEWTTYPFDGPVGGWRASVGPDGALWTISEEGLISFDGIARIIHPTPFTQPPDRSFTFTPIQWGIILDDWGPGVHTVFMEVDARPLTVSLVQDVSGRLTGRLIWDETVVDLCRIGIRNLEDGFLHIGDIFQTTEGCGANPTAMQDAFDQFGLPDMGCVAVRFGGVDHEYCAPLRATEDASVGSEPGTVTVVLDGLEGFEGLAVDAWVVPLEPTDEWQRLGGTSFRPINQDPVFGSDVIRPQGESYRVYVDGQWGSVDGEAATFEPGTYRFIIEAYVPLGDMRYGYEMPIQVVEGEPLVVTFTSLPAYTGAGIHWMPLDELEYPACPN